MDVSYRGPSVLLPPSTRHELRAPPRSWGRASSFAFSIFVTVFGVSYLLALRAADPATNVFFVFVLCLALGVASALVALVLSRRGGGRQVVVLGPDGLVLEDPDGRSTSVAYRDLSIVRRLKGGGELLLMGSGFYASLRDADAARLSRLESEVREHVRALPYGDERLRRMAEAGRILAAQLPAAGRRPKLATWTCAAVLVAVFAVEVWSGAMVDPLVLLALGANSAPLVKAGEWTRLLTANLLHGGWMHIFFNLYALLVLAAPLERILGTSRLTVVFLLSCLTGSIASAYVTQPYIGVGASTGIFGLLGGLSVLNWRTAEDRLKAARQQAVLLLVMLGLPAVLIPNADHMGHVGGLLGGMALTLLMTSEAAPVPSRRRGSWLTALLAAGLAAAFLTAGVSAFLRFTEEGREGIYLPLLRSLETPEILANEMAWAIAVSPQPGREELEAARDAMVWALENDDELALAGRDTLATVHYRLGDALRAIELESPLAGRHEDGFYGAQLLRFAWTRWSDRGPLLPEGFEAPRAVLVPDPLAGCEDAPRPAGLPSPAAPGLWVSPPAASAVDVDVALADAGRPVALVRLEVRSEISTWMFYGGVPEELLRCGVGAFVVRAAIVEEAAEEDVPEVRGRFWPMTAEVEALPGP